METMNWLYAAICFAILLVISAVVNKRRGIGRFSWLPWDYLMLFWAIALIVALAKLAVAWRDGL